MQIVNSISLNNSISVKIYNPNPQFNRFQFQSTITCAKTTNKNFLTSHRSPKTLISLVRFAASNLHYILPAPFNSVIRELNIDAGGGSGGSGGSWNRFRWGGFDGGGGGGGGRKRKRNKKSQFWFWGFVAVCCLGLGFWVFILGGEIRLEVKNEAVFAAMCLSMFLVLVLFRNGLVPEWVLGFCGGGVFVGLLLNNKDELKKFVKGLRIAKRRHMRIR